MLLLVFTQQYEQEFSVLQPLFLSAAVGYVHATVAEILCVYRQLWKRFSHFGWLAILCMGLQPVGKPRCVGVHNRQEDCTHYLHDTIEVLPIFMIAVYRHSYIFKEAPSKAMHIQEIVPKIMTEIWHIKDSLFNSNS